jgi:DNA invertase Pin-like site-specific DNA recombinase
MMNNARITPSHLRRNAYIYVRQSSEHQVRDNLESRQRQYELAGLARQYFWHEESIVVIDDDLGKSASTSSGRTGFAKLVADVALGKAGIIFGLEVSRLARNNRDWYQLLDLCSLAGTLIADTDGVYDPSSFNDRLLLGLKGTMSEAELHMLRGRMLQGMYHKARKGELRFHLPAGYQFDEDGKIIKSLDEQVTHIIGLTFSKFFEIGTMNGVLRYLLENKLSFPRKAPFEKHVRWVRPYVKAIKVTLKNPIYAGAYAFGRTKVIKELDEHGNQRSRRQDQAMGEWDVLIRDHHPGYISWDDYLGILRQIEKNAAVLKSQASHVVREGSALLQGLARCGNCGRSLLVQYHGQGSKSYPYYVCNSAHRHFSDVYCQSVGGRRIDQSVAESFLDVVSPANLKIHVEALRQIQDQQDMALKQLELQLERSEYESERAFRQFNAVEPENRLVARTLERQWNESLKRVEELKAHIRERKQSLRDQLSKIEVRQVLGLASDLPALWDAAAEKDKKRLLRAAIAEVILSKKDRDVTVKIVWAGGAVTEKVVHLPKVRNKRATSLDLVEFVRQLAAKYSDDQIARILMRQGRRTPTGLSYNAQRIGSIRQNYNIPRYMKPKDEQPQAYTAQQASKILQVSVPTIHVWLKSGFIKGSQVVEGAPWEILLTNEDVKRLTAQSIPQGWLPLSEAAAELGVSRQTVLNWVKSGKYQYIYVSKGNKKGLRINVNSGSCRKQLRLVN